MGSGATPRACQGWTGEAISDQLPSLTADSRSLLCLRFKLLALLFEHRSAAQLDLVAFKRQDLDQDLVAFLQLVTHLLDTRLGDLADMQQAVGAWEDLDKRAEIDQTHHFTQIRFPHLGCGRDVGNDLDRLLRRGFVSRGYM